MTAYFEWRIHENECQLSINDYWSGKYGNSKVIRSLLCTTSLLAIRITKMANDMVTVRFWSLASPQSQCFWLCIFGNLIGNWLQPFTNEVLPAIRANHNSDTLPASPRKWAWTEPQQFMVLHLGNLIGDCLQTSTNVVFATFRGKTKATHSLPHPENERQPGVNDFWSCTWGSLTDNCLQTSINEILAAVKGGNNSETITSPSWNWV